jgi:hypothetical protein
MRYSHFHFHADHDEWFSAICSSEGKRQLVGQRTSDGNLLQGGKIPIAFTSALNLSSMSKLIL